MEFLKKLRHWKDVEEYSAQTVIFSEGDPADVLYVIMAGSVELTLRGAPLATEESGGIIGESAVSASATRSATAKSLTDVTLARLNRDEVNALMAESTEFSLHIMAVLANRLRAVNRYIAIQFEPV